MKQFRIATLLMTAMLLSGSRSNATDQQKDTVRFGGRRYAIDQIPMLGLWDYGEGDLAPGKERPPKLEVRSTANWAGYTARWEISDAKLRLNEINGWIGGKAVKNEAILKGRKFPVVAEWFTGRIYLPVGDPDRETGHNTAVIVFHIQKGSVKKMTFLESSPPVHSWNGVMEPVPAAK